MDKTKNIPKLIVNMYPADAIKRFSDLEKGKSILIAHSSIDERMLAYVALDNENAKPRITYRDLIHDSEKHPYSCKSLAMDIQSILNAIRINLSTGYLFKEKGSIEQVRQILGVGDIHINCGIKNLMSNFRNKPQYTLDIARSKHMLANGKSYHISSCKTDKIAYIGVYDNNGNSIYKSTAINDVQVKLAYVTTICKMSDIILHEVLDEIYPNDLVYE